MLLVGALVGVFAVPRMGGTPPFKIPSQNLGLQLQLWRGCSGGGWLVLWCGGGASGCSGEALVGVSDGGQP